MKEPRRLQKTDPPTRRRADRRTAAVITEYIHELVPPGRGSPALRAIDLGRSS